MLRDLFGGSRSSLSIHLRRPSSPDPVKCTDCTCCAHRTPDGVCARTAATLPAGVHTPKVQEGRLSDVGGALPADGHVVACSKKKDKVARGGAFAMGREKNNKKNKKTRKKQPLSPWGEDKNKQVV